MSLFQYFKDTTGELKHVAWPTRAQTIIYTILVVLLSIFIALYLGFFDYVFTTGLARLIEVLPQGTPFLDVEQIDLSTTTTSGATTTE